MNNNNGLLLWVDDEIELLKAYIIFLEKKGYEVVTVSNGADAIDQCRACQVSRRSSASRRYNLPRPSSW